MVGLIVVAIVIVLAFVGIKGFSSTFSGGEGYFQARTNSLDVSKEQDVVQIGSALAVFAAGNSGEYPGSLDILVSGGYLKSVPIGSTLGSGYSYQVSGDRRSASVYGKLEINKFFCWKSDGMAARQVNLESDCRP